MPAVTEWDVLLRGGVLRALGQRGCRSAWTVSNFRGRARVHITARAGDGHRKQLLLPYPWESDQLEAIRDGVVTVYGAFQNGVPLELSIAELGTAKAEARRQAEAMASKPSNPQQSFPSPATASRPISIDWAGLIRRYQQHKLRSGEIKETTWERLYKPRMALVLKTAKGPPAVRDAPQLLEAQADLGVSALAVAPEDCKSSTPLLCCVGRPVRSCFQPNGLRRMTSQHSSAGHGRAERSQRQSPRQPSWRWCRPSRTRAGGLPFNGPAPLVCDLKSCSICSFARDGSGARMKRSPLAAKPSPGPCGSCPVTNGPWNRGTPPASCAEVVFMASHPELIWSWGSNALWPGST
jgi:hypothetical protein